MARKTAGEPEARQSLRSAVCSRFGERAAWVVCRVGRTIDDGARPAFLYALAVLYLVIVAVHLAVGVVHPLAAGGQELLPISTPLPAPTPSPTELATIDSANLWVYLFDDPATPFVTGYFAVYVWSDFDAAPYTLSVFVDGTEYYNFDKIYTEDIYLMTCAFCALERKTHSSVQQVSAGLYLGANLTCARNYLSDSETSIFACDWR